MRLLVVISLLLIVMASAYAQDEIITLNSPELVSHKRALVRFAHEQHTENIGCNACHHDYDDYGVNTNEDEGQRCAECHTRVAQANPIPLMRAFHKQCKDCHQNLADKGEATGPLMCGQCHVRGHE